MKHIRGFASDNNAGVHPEIFKAMAEANQGHVVAYGDDVYTERAVKIFQRHFGKDCAVFFVFNGTAANVLGITAITTPGIRLFVRILPICRWMNAELPKNIPAVKC